MGLEGFREVFPAVLIMFLYSSGVGRGGEMVVFVNLYLIPIFLKPQGYYPHAV